MDITTLTNAIATRFNLTSEDQDELRSIIQSHNNFLPPLSPVKPPLIAIVSGKKDYVTYLEKHHPGTKVIIIIDYRDRSHAILGPLDLLSTTTLSTFGSLQKDATIGQGYFISKKRLNDVTNDFTSRRIPFVAVSKDVFMSQ